MSTLQAKAIALIKEKLNDVDSRISQARIMPYEIKKQADMSPDQYEHHVSQVVEKNNIKLISTSRELTDIITWVDALSESK